MKISELTNKELEQLTNCKVKVGFSNDRLKFGFLFDGDYLPEGRANPTHDETTPVKLIPYGELIAVQAKKNDEIVNLKVENSRLKKKVLELGGELE